MQKVQQFIDDVSQQKNGFKFDTPWRVGQESPNVIVPITRISNKKRNYITLAEAKNVQIEDTGQIDYIYVKNNEDMPLYISRGEYFRGKTQERVAIHGYLIEPGKGTRVSVRCIHASKGINTKAGMEYGGKVPYTINLSSQRSTWDTVSYYTSHINDHSGVDNFQTRSINSIEIGTSDPSCIWTTDIGAVLTSDSSDQYKTSDDLAKTLDLLSDSIKDMMKKIPYIDNQVGAIFLKENEIQGLDVYDLKDSWKSVKDDVVEKEGASFLNKDESTNLFEFKPKKVAALLKKKLGVTFEPKIIYDSDYKVIEVKSDTLIGEAVVYKNEVIHLTLAKKEIK